MYGRHMPSELLSSAACFATRAEWTLGCVLKGGDKEGERGLYLRALLSCLQCLYCTPTRPAWPSAFFVIKVNRFPQIVQGFVINKNLQDAASDKVWAFIFCMETIWSGSWCGWGYTQISQNIKICELPVISTLCLFNEHLLGTMSSGSSIRCAIHIYSCGLLTNKIIHHNSCSD